MFDRKIVFHGSGIKILGPRIGGGTVDDLDDLIDGDGDGKCREANGDFIPCPPKELVNLVRDLRERVKPFNDTDGRALAGSVENQILNLRGGNYVIARRRLGELEQLIRGREQAVKPPPQGDPDAPLPVRRFRRGDANALFERARNLVNIASADAELRNRISELEDQQFWLRDRLGWLRWRDQDAFTDTQLVGRYNDLQQLVYEIEKIAAAKAKNGVNENDIDVDAIIQERRKTAKAKAKKIAENAKKFIPQEVRNFFQRRSINNMDNWVTGTPQEQKEKLEKWARRMFENTFEDLNGRKYTVKIDDDGLSIRRDGASIEGAIYDDNGEEVGRFYRTLDFKAKSVYHNSFKMNEDQRGNGVGSAFVRASEILYKKAGFEKISVTGASNIYGYKGATHWPKMGFDWANTNQKSEFLEIIQIAVRNYDEELFSSRREFEETRALLRRAVQDSPNDPNRVLPGDLLRFKGAEKHFQNMNAMIGYKLNLKDV